MGYGVWGMRYEVLSHDIKRPRLSAISLGIISSQLNTRFVSLTSHE